MVICRWQKERAEHERAGKQLLQKDLNIDIGWIGLG